MKPGSGGVPPTPAGAKLGVCGTMMDQFEHTCIPNDGLARYPTNSTATCCSHCLATRGCFSCERFLLCHGRARARALGAVRLMCLPCLQGWCGTMKECAISTQTMCNRDKPFLQFGQGRGCFSLFSLLSLLSLCVFVSLACSLIPAPLEQLRGPVHVRIGLCTRRHR